MIRKIYLFASMLILVGSFALPVYLYDKEGLAFGILFYCVYCIISLIVSFISMQKGITDGDIDDFVILPFGFLTIRFKRVYYSDLGYFWIRKSGYEVYLYEQRLLSMHKISEVFWENDIEDLKLKIKEELESVYKEKLEVKRKKDLYKKIWNDWDGSIDKKS